MSLPETAETPIPHLDEPCWVPLAPSPHLTGGAVDVTLCDADGLMLEMGSWFDEPSPASHSDYLEHLDAPDARQRRARAYRRVLYHAMCGAGFSNLPSEWWHYDVGDQLWAYYGGHPRAHFGPARLDGIEERWKRRLGDG